MDPISPTTVSIADLIVSLISAVGVGSFILIVIVLMLFINLPTIITIIKNAISSNKELKNAKDLQRLIGEAQTTISNLVSSSSSQTKDLKEFRAEIKALVAIIDMLHASMHKEGEERRQENIILSDTLERQVRAIEAIDRMMRNVMSESDTLRMTAFVIGITSSLKADLLTKISAILESEKLDSGITGLNLRTDIETAWSDIKTEIDRFKTPLKIRLFLDEYQKNLWTNTGLFNKIINIASSTELSNDKKLATISKQLDNGLRELQSELTKYLGEIKAVTRGE